MFRFAILVVAASLIGAVQAQTSSNPGSAPLTGPSLSPGETPSQSVPFNSPTGTVQDNATQMEMSRCNSMAGGARELCVDDLRSRINNTTGARSAPGGLSNPGTPSSSGAGSSAGSTSNPGAPSRPAN